MKADPEADQLAALHLTSVWEYASPEGTAVAGQQQKPKRHVVPPKTFHVERGLC